jgi:hypothetical protein
MKKVRKLRGKRILAGALVVLALVVLSTAQLGAGVCEGALQRCLIDAALTTILSGPQAGAYYAGVCFLGYSWCLEYYKK